MQLNLSCGSDGFNTGSWQSSSFDFGDEGNNEGPYIASKPGKILVMDLTDEGVDDFEDTMDAYVNGDLPDNDGCSPSNFGYNDDTVLKKFQGKASKNGDKVKVQWASQGTYTDTDGKKDKDRKIKTKLKAKLNKVNVE